MDFKLELRKDINYINIMRYNIKIHKMFEQNIKKLQLNIYFWFLAVTKSNY